MALAAENGFNIFKGLKQGGGQQEEQATETLGGLQSLKYLLFHPLQKELANPKILNSQFLCLGNGGSDMYLTNAGGHVLESHR